MPRSLRAGIAALAFAAAPVFGQAIGQGFELERAGRHVEAAAAYLATLRGDPANLPALLGLERVLPRLGRLPELLPLVQRARERVPESGALRGLELRVYAGLNEPDSLAVAARRWAAAAPLSETPYREWALALADHRAFDDARQVLLLGRRSLGGATILAIELAELERRVGNWEGAAREWGHALAGAPELVSNAASQLADTPAPQRARVTAALTSTGATPRTQRLAAELLLGWGQAAEGWRWFEQSLAPGAPSPETATALRRYADLAAAVATPAGHRVRGLALSRWAELAPSPLAERARAEGVRELLQGGDRVAARAALERLAADSLAPPDAKVMAEAALIDVLIADGQLDAAERRLGADMLGGEDESTLRLMLARARVARGELDRAALLLRDDSSVAALAERGWIALYRGDLRGATGAFQAAGPYAGERAAATDRTAMLALVQQVPADTLPELGAALLTLARGDSAGAVSALRRVAGRLEPDGGRSDVLLLAGQVAARLGGPQDSVAARLFEEIARAGGTGAAAPAAELEWERLLVRQGHAADAIQRLEHLILSYPGSAFVPEARRELERARGAVPRS
jgi:tetratricopeptide (TPR) repeat protein